MIVDLATPTAERTLTALLANAAAETAARIQPPRLPLCLTYKEAGRQLGVGEDSIRALVHAGVLDRPEWSRNEIEKAVVTTASVARAAGWPVAALEVAA